MISGSPLSAALAIAVVIAVVLALLLVGAWGTVADRGATLTALGADETVRWRVDMAGVCWRLIRTSPQRPHVEGVAVTLPSAATPTHQPCVR